MTYLRLSRRSKGAALVLLAAMMAVLICFASLTVDVGMVQVAKQQLRATVDAAALAAGGGLATSPAEARTRAKAIALSNHVLGSQVTLLDSDIEMGTWNSTTRTFTVLTGANESTANAVRVTARLTSARNSGVRLAFVPMISGKQTTDVTTSAISAASGGSEDIMLVQDVSGSFTDEIDEARDGDRSLLASLNVTGTKSTFGFVAFTGTAVSYPPTAVATNYSFLYSAINYLQVGGSMMPSTSTGTDIAAGLEEALDVFNGITKTSNSRSIVLVSDGEPSAAWGNAHPGYSSSQLLTLAQAKADLCWAAGINVYVVFWDDANSTTKANNLKSLIRGKGTFTHVTNPANIASSIGMVLKARSQLVK